jgi:hypothetical protein
MTILAGSSVDAGREYDAPKAGRWGGEFNGNEGTFARNLRRAHDFSFDAFLRLLIFDSNLGSDGKRVGKNDQAAILADGVRYAADRFGPPFQVNLDGHPQEDTLSAAALLRRGRARGNHSRGRFCGTGLYGSCRLHSSIPQKSISGATNSTPYSQPSGRGLPFQTTTAALLAPLMRLVRARRCSKLSE